MPRYCGGAFDLGVQHSDVGPVLVADLAVAPRLHGAVANGVLDFLQANPDLNTKNVKPQPLRDDGLPPPETDPNTPEPPKPVP